MKNIKDIEIIKASQNQLLIQTSNIKKKWFSNMDEKDIKDFTVNYLHLFF